MTIIPQPCRCGWVDLSKPDYVTYHDEEWGVPVHDDRKLFEFLVLESAQTGLSWYTILRKRENYRQAFDGFDPEKIALYDDNKVQELLNNPGIVRNRLKILATINNAQCFLAVQAEFGSFDTYIWQFVGGKPIVNHWKTLAECPTTTPESDAMSKDLRQTLSGIPLFTAFRQRHTHLEKAAAMFDNRCVCRCGRRLSITKKLHTNNPLS